MKFVARHSDLSSSDESESDFAPETAPEDLDEGFDATTSDEDSRIQARPKRPIKKYSHRQIRAAGVRDQPGDGRDQTYAAKTPSDRKKRRRWEWTLGPLDEEVADQTTPVSAAIIATVRTTTSDEGQASTALPAESQQASARHDTQSPASRNSSTSPTLPPKIPLP